VLTPTENDFVLFESEDPELERKRRKRDQRVKQRIAALSQEELATLSALSEQALCAQLLAWGIEVGNNQGKWSCAEIVAAAVAYIEDVREELRTQEAAKNEELEHARHAHEGYVK
jgi:transposase-like protein